MRSGLALAALACALAVAAAVRGVDASPAPAALSVAACAEDYEGAPCTITAQLVDPAGQPVADAGVTVHFTALPTYLGLGQGVDMSATRVVTGASGSASTVVQMPGDQASVMVVAQAQGLGSGYVFLPSIPNTNHRPIVSLEDVQPASPLEGQTGEAAQGDAVEMFLGPYPLGVLGTFPYAVEIQVRPADALAVTDPAVLPEGPPGTYLLAGGASVLYQLAVSARAQAAGTVSVAVSLLGQPDAGEGQASLVVTPAPVLPAYAAIGPDGLAVTAAHPLVVDRAGVWRPIALTLSLVDGGRPVAVRAPVTLALAVGSGARVTGPGGGPAVSSVRLTRSGQPLALVASAPGSYIVTATPVRADLDPALTTVQAPQAVDQGQALVVTVEPRDANGVPVSLADGEQVQVLPAPGSAVTPPTAEVAQPGPAGAYEAAFTAAAQGGAAVFAARLKGDGKSRPLGGRAVTAVGHVGEPTVAVHDFRGPGGLGFGPGLRLTWPAPAGADRPIGYVVYRGTGSLGPATSGEQALAEVPADASGGGSYIDRDDLLVGPTYVYGVAAIDADGAIGPLATLQASFGPAVLAASQPSPTEVDLRLPELYGRASTDGFAIVTDGTAYVPSAVHRRGTMARLVFPQSVPEDAGSLLVTLQDAFFDGEYVGSAPTVWRFTAAGWQPAAGLFGLPGVPFGDGAAPSGGGASG